MADAMQDAMMQKRTVGEFTRAEFVEFVRSICAMEGVASEAEDDRRVLHFESVIEPHPAGADLIFWPEEGHDGSPEDVTNEVERFFAQRGGPVFRQG